MKVGTEGFSSEFLIDNALGDIGVKAMQMNPAPASKEDRSYALLTAAYNEEQHIETTIRSVVAQFHGPKIWAIVSDGSTDRTDEIVQQYALQHSFIRPLRRERNHCREFASKIFALRAGFQASRSPQSASSVTWMPTYGCTHLIFVTCWRNSKKIPNWVSLEDGISRSAAMEYGNRDPLTPQDRYRVEYRCSGANATTTYGKSCQ